MRADRDLLAVAVRYSDAYVDGELTIRACADLGLITEARTFTLPVLLGTGIRLFPDGIPQNQSWPLVDVSRFPCGTVLSRYTPG